MEKNILNQKKWKITKKLLTFRYGYDIITESATKGNSSMAEQRSPKPLMGVRIPLPLLLKASVIQRWVIGVFCFFYHSSRTSVRLGAWFWSAKLTYSLLFTYTVLSNGILPMLRIPNRQNLLPELYRTEFSVQKIPICK